MSSVVKHSKLLPYFHPFYTLTHQQWRLWQPLATSKKNLYRRFRGIFTSQSKAEKWKSF